jgi:hypothetical protein
VRGRHRRLASGMSRAHHDYIELFGKLHHSYVYCTGKPFAYLKG